MQVGTQVGAIQEIAAELIVVNLFQGATSLGGASAAVDRALGGALSDLIASGDLTGKLGETTVLYPRDAIPAKRVMVVGLGKRDELNLTTVRRASACAAQAAQKLKTASFYTILHGTGAGGLEPAAVAQTIVEGTILGTYRFTGYGTPAPDAPPTLEQLTLVVFDESMQEAVTRGAEIGRLVAESTCMARDLVSRPGNYLTPALLAEVALSMADEVGLRCEVLDEARLAELGMGALLGVAQGSQQPPRFIILEHLGAARDAAPYVVVGKGITFDSGGISLKPGDGMEKMKYDMAGAAATLGVLRAVGLMRLPLNVVGLIPATENLPSGTAYKPGDVLKAMSGLTIEVISTDAEGRLILADALAYAARYKPQAVVDLATLTGGCIVALGHVASGLLGNDEALIEALREAASQSSEMAWPLPLWEDYAEQIKSDVADIKNSGGREASTITGGMFLKRFAEGYPWAHLDIAGMAWSEQGRYDVPKGATGYGVRLLTQWLRNAAGV
jgi:leucyl aminopeptidase